MIKIDATSFEIDAVFKQADDLSGRQAIAKLVIDNIGELKLSSNQYFELLTAAYPQFRHAVCALETVKYVLEAYEATFKLLADVSAAVGRDYAAFKDAVYNNKFGSECKETMLLLSMLMQSLLEVGHLDYDDLPLDVDYLDLHFVLQDVFALIRKHMLEV